MSSESGGQLSRAVYALAMLAAFYGPRVAAGGGADTGHRVCGRVGDDDFAYADHVVTLRPDAVTTRTDASGRFCFEDVADGNRVVGVAQYCLNELACFPDQPITVDGSDVEAALVPQHCERAALHLNPAVGAPGTEVEVEGWCRCLHSGGSAPLYLDGVEVTRVRGDTGGCFQSRFRVPLRTTAGPHRLAVPLSFPNSDATAILRVPGVPGGCVGDCGGDDVVTIDDLLRGVGVALGAHPIAACPAIDRSGDGTAMVDELTAAVGHALGGCPALLAPVSLEAAYDVTAIFARGGERRGLAIVKEANDGNLSIRMIFNPLDWIEVRGLLGADGTAPLEGVSIQGGDIYSPAVGEAAADLAAPAQRLDGSLEVDDFFDGPETVTFALRRPESGTLAADRSYRLTLNHAPSSAVSFRSNLLMRVDDAAPRGLATCGGGDHFDEADRNLPGLAQGPCAVSPEGRFSFLTQYEEFTNAGGPLIHLFGALSGAGPGEAGAGTFYIGGFPSVLDHGTWTAQQQTGAPTPP